MTAWLLTWFWQGSALAGGVAVALRCVPRVNASTRHLIWCGALAAVAWLGWASSPYRGLTPGPVPGADPIYVPSAPDFLITIGIGIWAAITLVMLLRLLPGLRAVYALRDRCTPVPSSLESRLPLWLEAKARGRRTRLTICDAVPGATVLGFERPCIAIPSSLVDALAIDELDQVILHEYAARATSRRLVAARADAVALGAVDSPGGARRVARIESRARDGMRRMGCRADRSAEGLCQMPRARCGGADSDDPWLDAGARAHRRPPRARAARRSPAGRTRQGATERVAQRCHGRRVRDGAAIGANARCAVCGDCGDRSAARAAADRNGWHRAAVPDAHHGPPKGGHYRGRAPSHLSHPTHLTHPSHPPSRPLRRSLRRTSLSHQVCPRVFSSARTLTHPSHPSHLLHLLHPLHPLHPIVGRSRRPRRKPALALPMSSAAPGCRWRDASDAFQISVRDRVDGDVGVGRRTLETRSCRACRPRSRAAICRSCANTPTGWLGRSVSSCCGWGATMWGPASSSGAARATTRRSSCSSDPIRSARPVSSTNGDTSSKRCTAESHRSSA